ncbi:MAG: nucleotide kinase domain-containing protein [Myxococcota bacterium]|nr:nucleotide kinase domain-containing protein [Myxococcota bacterium]
MSNAHNPYAHALDGLVLDDPVAAFFDFCRERERIRLLRESGAPPPWSENPIFQKGRFLNVFREDDRGSQAIQRFASPLAEDLPRLVHALFFARWCNQPTTIDSLSPDQLDHPERLKHALESLAVQPWCNVTAYPVEPVRWEGKLYSRLDTATTLFAEISGFLAQTILDADSNVVRATEAINHRLGMGNDFPIFMAVIDIAWFRPDVIDPASHVPTGIGAVAYLDRLQQHLNLDSHAQTCTEMIALQAVHWPEAKRPFHPIDIEYLSCECRKFYSYLNGTKRFEGKNVFKPGKSAQLTFDIPERSPTPHTTQIHVIAGGPCSGKTTVLNALGAAGYRVEPETAETVLQAGIAAGHTAEDLRADPVQWQQDLLLQDYSLFESLPVDTPVFTDTSFIETVVFGARAGLSLGPNIDCWIRNKRYKTVFFLAPLEDYEQSQVRMESHEIAQQISVEVQKTYNHYGYDLVVVPALPLHERVAFILSTLEKSQGTP